MLAGDYLGNLVGDMATKAPDHVVVTGDLINIALPGEFKSASAFLKLLGSPEDVFTICGNHDAYVKGALKKSIESWRDYMSADDRKMSGSQDYPAVRIRDDVALIACNSAEPTPFFFATGYFRKDQANRLAKILQENEDKCRVVMIHHPPLENSTLMHKRLIGLELFQEVIRKHGAEMVLHGHTHLATRNEIAGPDSPVPVICVPAAGLAQYVNNHPAGRYNLFTIEGKKGKWSINMEEYGMAENSDGISLVAEHKLA